MMSLPDGSDGTGGGKRRGSAVREAAYGDAVPVGCRGVVRVRRDGLEGAVRAVVELLRGLCPSRWPRLKKPTQSIWLELTEAAGADGERRR